MKISEIKRNSQSFFSKVKKLFSYSALLLWNKIWSKFLKMITRESVKSMLWWTVFIILAIITYYQLSVTIQGWNSRPFDEYVESANKQDVPFPSVTVCPSGIKLGRSYRFCTLVAGRKKAVFWNNLSEIITDSDIKGVSEGTMDRMFNFKILRL